MERSSKRGKIPQHDWPSIIKRYEDGETLSSIARTYDCSPPAISYIISRSRARDASEGAEPTEIEAPEAQLVKGQANDMRTAEAVIQRSEINEAAAPSSAAHPSYPHESPGPTPSLRDDLPNGVAEPFDGSTENALPESPEDSAYRQTAPAPQVAHLATSGSPGREDVRLSSSEHRRTLHLSLSHKNPLGEENSHDGAARPGSEDNSSRPVENQPPGSTRHFVHQNSAANGTLDNGGNGSLVAAPHQQRGGGAFIDRALRQRVDGDISAFLAAFDAALADDTIESRAGLREATDRLLRAGARTRIELERLEARSPLSARDTAGYAAPNWRTR
jgi:hypothetical protein